MAQIVPFTVMVSVRVAVGMPRSACTFCSVPAAQPASDAAMRSKAVSLSAGLELEKARRAMATVCRFATLMWCADVGARRRRRRRASAMCTAWSPRRS